MNTLASFTKGQHVTYTGHAHGRTGQSGTVIRPVKSRGVVTLRWASDGAWFDARPENLEMRP